MTTKKERKRKKKKRKPPVDMILQCSIPETLTLDKTSLAYGLNDGTTGDSPAIEVHSGWHCQVAM